MKMKFTGKPGVFGIVMLAVFTALGPLAKPIAGQSSREAEGARLLQGAIDMHFHMEAHTPAGAGGDLADIATVRVASSRGMRGLVIKNHYEPTATLVYLLRKEIHGLDLFGGIAMNLSNGGMNPAAVEYMATQIRGTPGKVVWMPARDAEIEILHNCIFGQKPCSEPFVVPSWPYKPFVAVSSNGELLPETKAVISLIAKYHLILGSGHIAPEEALLAFREARSQGVQHMIATHAMDLIGKMNMDQMLEAAKLGAVIEFDFRKVLDQGGMDAIRKIGPEHCLISEFWTNGVRKTPPPVKMPIEYAGLDGMGAFVEAARSRGFTDHELDLMFKENPARLLELSGK